MQNIDNVFKLSPVADGSISMQANIFIRKMRPLPSRHQHQPKKQRRTFPHEEILNKNAEMRVTGVHLHAHIIREPPPKKVTHQAMHHTSSHGSLVQSEANPTFRIVLNPTFVNPPRGAIGTRTYE